MTHPINYPIEIIGWLGASLVVLAYALLSSGKLESRSLVYQLMNIVGAAGFIVNSAWNGAYPSVGVNLIWMGIGFFALARRKPTSSR